MAVKKTPPLADILRDITEAAPALREAGVLNIEIGEVKASLAPMPPPEPKPAPKQPKEPTLGDLDDFFGDEERKPDRRPS